jgi:hypothetical protein
MPSRLALLRLDKSSPGFYDDPAFLAAEQRDASLLDAYAGYIDELSFDADYLSYARARVVASAKFLHQRLIADGRKGACVDMSQMLSRFLEQQGVWNYIVKGAAAVYPAPHTGISAAFHWLYDSQADKQSVAPHAWVCAPPCNVVDLTLGRQENAGDEDRLLQEPIVAEGACRSTPRIEEVFDPPLRDAYARQLGRPITMAALAHIDKALVTKLQQRGTWEVELANVLIRYVGVAVTAPDQPFEKARGWLLGGQSGWELWREFESTLPAAAGTTSSASHQHTTAVARRHMQDKKPRALRIGLDPLSLQGVAGMRINGDGAIEFFGDEGQPMAVARSSTGLAYERAKGPKITATIFDAPGPPATVAAATSKFARVFGIDTNTRTIRGERVSVSVVAELHLQAGGATWSCSCPPLWATEIRGIEGEPEPIGWFEGLARINARGWMAGGTVLMVVDAFLGDLPRIARRELPLLGDCYLPDGVSLAYASADVPNESPLNRLIAVCDATANRVLDHVEQEATAPSLTVVEGAPFRGQRDWRLDVQ